MTILYTDHPNYREVHFSENLLFSPENTATGATFLIHGLTGCPDEMRHLGSFLADAGFDGIAPQLPGHRGDIQELKKITANQWVNFITEEFEQYLEKSNHFPHLIGQSFGAILAMYLAGRFSSKVKTLTLLSPPVYFRSSFTGALLNAFSLFPDALLNIFPSKRKTERPDNYLEFQHHAYPKHCIGALARMIQIWREAESMLHHIQCPVLIICDPRDHHLHPNTANILQEQLPAKILLYPGGQHELLLGPHWRTVYAEIRSFLQTSQEI